MTEIQSDQRELLQNVQKSCDQADYFSKLFLKPIEIKLADNFAGLDRVIWTPDAPDKYYTTRIMQQPIKKQYTPKDIAQENLLSYFSEDPKNSNLNIKLAICVCAYSEDSSMVKRTLSGIRKNYKYFSDAGISPSEIAVIFIFDGIQKVHPSVQTFVTNLDRDSKFIWKEYASTLQQLREVRFLDYDDINLYSRQELERLNAELLPTKKKEYARNVELVQQLTALKSKKRISPLDLPEEAEKQYMNALRKEHQMQMGIFDQKDAPNHPNEYYKQFFENKPQLREKCVFIAIAETQNLCKKYLQARADTSRLYSYRLKTEEEQDSYLFICVKHRNQGKLWSQNWFFNGFCRLMKPNITILLDVGVIPKPDSLFKMYSYLATHENCGGVCGYLALSLEAPEDTETDNLDFLSKAASFVFDIQKAQQFQYHFAHMLDKPFEAAFGYIHVLPGAFSGYNMRGLFNQYNEVLSEYFKSLKEQQLETQQQQQFEEKSSIFWRSVLPRWMFGSDNYAYRTLKQKNVYLAEDRILCFGIHRQNMTMAYLPDAEALVDSVTTLDKLMGQRKRWINGSYFAFEKVRDYWKCGQSCGFSFQVFIYVLISYLSYISIALFFVTLDITVNTFNTQVVFPSARNLFGVQTNEQLQNYYFGILPAYSFIVSLPYIFDFVYVVMVCSIIVLSLNLNQTNQKFKQTYYHVTSVLGWYSILMYGILIYQLVVAGSFLNTQNNQFILFEPTVLRLIISIVILMHFIPPIIFILMKRSLKYGCQILISSISYLFYAPAYLHVLMVFAYCRIDDISWGTKGLTTTRVHKLMNAWTTEKYIFICKFVITNIIVAVVLKMLCEEIGPRSVVVLVLALVLGLMVFVKLIIGMGYLLRYACDRKKIEVKEGGAAHRIEKMQQVYQSCRPFLIDGIKNSYQKYIIDIAQSKIIPKGLKSTFFKSNRQQSEFSKIVKKGVKLQKPQMSPQKYNKYKSKQTSNKVIAEDPSSEDLLSENSHQSQKKMFGFGKYNQGADKKIKQKGSTGPNTLNLGKKIGSSEGKPRQKQVNTREIQLQQINHGSNSESFLNLGGKVSGSNQEQPIVVPRKHQKTDDDNFALGKKISGEQNDITQKFKKSRYMG